MYTISVFKNRYSSTILDLQRSISSYDKVMDIEFKMESAGNPTEFKMQSAGNPTKFKMEAAGNPTEFKMESAGNPTELKGSENIAGLNIVLRYRDTISIFSNSISSYHIVIRYCFVFPKNTKLKKTDWSHDFIKRNELYKFIFTEYFMVFIIKI
jgi:hypothetical protein